MTIIKTCVPAEIMTAAKKRSRAEVQSNYIHNCQTEGSSVAGEWPLPAAAMTNCADFNSDMKHMFYFVCRFRGLIK